MSADPKRSRSGRSSPPACPMISRPTLAMTPRAISSIMAAAPVLDMNGEVAAPMKPKAMMMRWVEHAADTSSALATFRITHRHNPTTPVIGIASVIHQVTTRPRTAARPCCSSSVL